IAALGRAGFDATQGQSLCVVDPPADRPHLDPRWTRQTVEHLVYLPCYPEIPSREVARMAAVVRQALAQVPAEGPAAEVNPPPRHRFAERLIKRRKKPSPSSLAATDSSVQRFGS
ncbi:MAG: hypothetical protein WD278_18405, partial [Pirellulales bacterium]